MPEGSPNAATEPPVSPEPPPDWTPTGEQSAGTPPSPEASLVGSASAGPATVPAKEPGDAAAATPGVTDNWVPTETPGAADHEAALAAGTPARDTPAAVTFAAPDFSREPGTTDLATIDMLDDVELDVKVELGRTEMLIEQVLGLGVGSVVELDKAAGDPVDIYVNERLVARGEVLVLNNSFCVRVSDIVSPIPALGKEE